MPKVVAITILGGLLIGLTTRGRASRLASIRFKVLPVLYLALVAGLIPLFVSLPRDASRVLVAASYVLLAVFLSVNLRGRTLGIRAGLTVVLLGWALNALPIIINGGMPLSLIAYRRAGYRDIPIPTKGGLFKVIIAGPHTILRPLGDVIPVGVIHEVLSPGDIAVGIGLAMVLIAGMHQRGAIATQGRD